MCEVQIPIDAESIIAELRNQTSSLLKSLYSIKHKSNRVDLPIDVLKDSGSLHHELWELPFRWCKVDPSVYYAFLEESNGAYFLVFCDRADCDSLDPAPSSPFLRRIADDSGESASRIRYRVPNEIGLILSDFLEILEGLRLAATTGEGETLERFQHRKELLANISCELIQLRGYLKRRFRYAPSDDTRVLNYDRPPSRSASSLQSAVTNGSDDSIEGTRPVASPCIDFWHSSDYLSCKVTTSDGIDHTFSLTSRQAQIVQFLYERLLQGVPEVLQNTVMSEINSESSRFWDAFKSRPEIKGLLIISGRAKGSVMLNVSLLDDNIPQ